MAPSKAWDQKLRYPWGDVEIQIPTESGWSFLLDQTPQDVRGSVLEDVVILEKVTDTGRVEHQNILE